MNTSLGTLKVGFTVGMYRLVYVYAIANAALNTLGGLGTSLLEDALVAIMIL